MQYILPWSVVRNKLVMLMLSMDQQVHLGLTHFGGSGFTEPSIRCSE